MRLARPVVALLITFAVVGAAGYFVMLAQLGESQVARYAAIQHADVQGLEALGRNDEPAVALREIGEVLGALGRRPGTLEVMLIDQRGIIRASGNAAAVVGRKNLDAGVAAALTQGRRYAGRETDAGNDHDNFEFVSPVELPAGRYALEMTYDHHFLDANLGVVRRTLGWIGLLALVGGGGMFYFVGGRTLLLSHRMALQRATRDGLTDLPNRRAFQAEFEQAVASATRHEEALTLAVLDLDDFKFLNDRHGHPHGDAVLRRVAGVMREGRIEDRAYRIGGDEFAMLLPHTDERGAMTLARRLSRALSATEALVSIGISDLRAGQSGESLHAEADAALYEAKRVGGHGVVHFDEIRDQVVITSSDKNDAVRRLIDESALSSVFQPIWDLDPAVLLGVEALMRPDPDYGLQGPAEVFDIAEQIGRVHELDQLCVRSALRSAPELAAEALLFINLSPQTLDLDADGNDWLREEVERAKFPLDRVVVEVTERFGGRTASVVKCLRRLREQGFKLALDDVGTGNSGLEMLRQVEAEYVKIDRSIVVAAATEPAARGVLMAMATYAGETGSFVIAEGIEDQDTLDFLDAIDDPALRPERIIRGGQGYGLGRPGPRVASEPPVLLTRPYGLAGT